MVNINLLTTYLNPKKYDAYSRHKDTHYLIRIDSDFLDEEQFSFSKNVTKIIRKGSPVAEDLGGGFLPINIQYPLVVTRNGDEVDYYFKRIRNGETTYISLEHVLIPNTSSDESYFLPYDNLTFIPIELQHLHYYHVEQQKIYSVEIALPEIKIFGHKTLDYNPKDLGGLTNGEYQLDYKNASGYRNTPIEVMLGELLLEQSKEEYKKRIINLSLYKEAGEIYWYPKIIKEQGKITLYYEYHKLLNDHFEIPITNGRFQPAIKLTFNHLEGFLAFMELTYFRNGVSPLDIWEGTNFRKRDCFKKYVEIVTEELEIRTNNIKSKFSIVGILVIIYYIPLDFFIKEQNLFRDKKNRNILLGERFIWFAIDSVIKFPITNITVNVEDITIKLFEILQLIQQHKNIENNEKNDYLLDKLLSKTYEGRSYLITFYHKMNTNNFVRYNYFIYKIWRKSSYFKRDHEVYKNTSYYTKITKKEEKKEPWKMLPYKSNKIIGFHTSNTDVVFDENDNIVFTPDIHWSDELYGAFFPESADDVTALIEGNWQLTYHPLYPVSLPNPTDKDAIKLQKISPALLIKASEDKAFWNNVGTTVSYTFDILTSLSGFGNLAKFRHLARIADAADIIKNGIRLKNTFYVYKAAKGVAAAIEISSGTINILLKITGLEDTEFGRALTNFLFWLEMLTLSVDLTDAISGGLKINAKIISKESDLLAKKLDEFVAAKQIDEADKARILDEISEIAGKNKKAKSIWHVNRNIYTGEVKGSYNCVNCALAVDRTLAGLPTSAVTFTIRKRWKGGKYVNTISYKKGTSIKVLEKEYGRKFILNMRPKEIRQTLKLGQRGIVYGKINGRNSGHVFNVLNENGVVKFLDGQTGRKANLIYDEYRFLPTNF
ncbi:toxin glutamine deamidase domain-containing protein [Kordia jejudonensis]|uniref:toxin glutamine deamidase domain-containing protein n=1 Tax=Kordia jejudonensis TaxID=1348245 RepID=UPI000629BAEA|nr:toxin glutamine deamidase domain-containing protein [Kordia jejudonensis]